MEAETQAMRLQTKETPGAARSWERPRRIPPKPSDSTRALQHLDSGLSASKNWEEYTSLVLSHVVCGYMLQQPQKCPVSGRIGIETKAYLTTTTGRLPTGWLLCLNLFPPCSNGINITPAPRKPRGLEMASS